MLNIIRALTKRQKVYVLLALDLALIPLALMATYALQALPRPALDTMLMTLPQLPYLLMAGAAISLWLGLPTIQLKAYESHAVGLTAILSVLLAGTSALLSLVSGLPLPPGTHVIFGILYFLSVVAVRAVLYQVLTALYRRASPRCRVLIYGAGTTGMQLAHALKTHESIDPVAFVRYASVYRQFEDVGEFIDEIESLERQPADEKLQPELFRSSTS